MQLLKIETWCLFVCQNVKPISDQKKQKKKVKPIVHSPFISDGNCLMATITGCHHPQGYPYA